MYIQCTLTPEKELSCVNGKERITLTQLNSATAMVYEFPGGYLKFREGTPTEKQSFNCN